ncbi:MAG: YraN family protein [Patescibacteria group bacterium]|nr:YraN family protein [Patescibacteria group bacterium]
MKNLSLGRLGEKMAAHYLTSLGFQIVEMNFHKHWGELDIVALDNSALPTLVFVEVKTRMQGDRISPEESMTPRKISSVKRSGLYYKNLHPELPECLRIDFVGIVLDENYQILRVNYVKSISGW